MIDAMLASGPVLLVSRLLILIGWAYALGRIWHHRAHPQANQALAGSLAMVLAEALLISGADIPRDVIVFFIALAQLTLAISFSRLLAASKSVKEAGVSDAEGHPSLGGLYLRSLIVVTSAGVIFAAFQSWLVAS